MKEILLFKPVFKERIWGGTKLRDMYNYDIPSDRTGECWAIAAHTHGQSIVDAGKFKGQTLGALWENHRELFGNMKGDTFPLLTKILDAKIDLSVQVHPDDDYAYTHENGELGKTECWYIIDCDEDAEIIYGHHAESKDQFEQMVQQGSWDQLLRKIKVKPGDFFYVPSGTIHALGKGTVVLETQQNSDTTYRVYDYDRRDQDGKLRELHIEKSLDVTTVPHVDHPIEPMVSQQGDTTITKYVDNDFFTVYKWDILDHYSFDQKENFMLASVIEGHGTFNTADQEVTLKKGDHFLMPYGLGQCQIDGNLKMIVSHV